MGTSQSHILKTGPNWSEAKRAITSIAKNTGEVKCECRTVMVVYDLTTQTPMQMPDEYKQAICEYEGRTVGELAKKS